MFTVHAEGGYVKVKRDGRTIAAFVDRGTKTVRDLEFLEPEHRKNNKTRQAVCRALEKAGYR